MVEDIRISIDEGDIDPGSTVLLGFPDVGLVGPIAIKQVIDQLGMEEVGYMDSDEFPPITSIHDARPTYPIRIYKKEDMVVVASEIPITPDIISPFSHKLLEWFGDINPEKVIILGGLAHQDRTEIEKSEVHGIPSEDRMEKVLDERELHLLEEGFITGINGVLLRALLKNEIPGIYLMADSFQKYPDPGAAASILKALNEMEDIEISIDELKEKEEEIRVATRDLMRQTKKAMDKAGKDQEEEMPVMYG